MIERTPRHRDAPYDGRHGGHGDLQDSRSTRAAGSAPAARPSAARATAAERPDDARPLFMRRVLLWFVLPLALLAAIGCDKSQAFGEPNSIIVGATDELWMDVQNEILDALEPRILTVRDERTLKVTQQDPTRPDWNRLNIFRQVLVVGTAEDRWVDEALGYVRRNPEISPPQILQADNVWARGQLVTILLLPDPSEMPASQAMAQLSDSLGALLGDQYRQFVVSRMYTTGRDTALVRELRETAGFSLTLPQVYRWDEQDSVYKFRNDNPDPSELIREIAVSWRDIPDEPLDQDDILAKRANLVENYYREDQRVDLSLAEFREIQFGDWQGYQLQAIWQSAPGSWPAAGPFITRVIRCPEQNREYMLDAWLYAPGKDKYEYMIQLQTILDSFRCG